MCCGRYRSLRSRACVRCVDTQIEAGRLCLSLTVGVDGAVIPRAASHMNQAFAYATPELPAVRLAVERMHGSGSAAAAAAAVLPVGVCGK